MGDGTSTITYESLFELVRNEKNNGDLQKLDAKTVNALLAYLQKKMQIYQKTAANPSVSDLEKSKIKIQVQNTRKLIKELFDRRQKKLVDIGMNFAKTKALVKDANLLLEEKEFLDRIIDVLKDYRQSVLLPWVNAKKAAYLPRDEQEQDIEFISPVPKFLGPDLEILGPFAQGDKARLPLKVAEILLKKGKVRNLFK